MARGAPAPPQGPWAARADTAAGGLRSKLIWGCFSSATVAVTLSKSSVPSEPVPEWVMMLGIPSPQSSSGEEMSHSESSSAVGTDSKGFLPCI